MHSQRNGALEYLGGARLRLSAVCELPSLGSKDSNLDAQLQRLLCYRYTTPQRKPLINTRGNINSTRTDAVSKRGRDCNGLKALQQTAAL